MLSYESWMFVKENPDRQKKNSSTDSWQKETWTLFTSLHNSSKNVMMVIKKS